MSEVINIKELNERIERESIFVDTLRTEMGKVIVGQSHLVDTLLIGLLSNGHILLEGVPGLAKTLAITTLAKAVDAGFSRIQFTPDLLPADLIGTLIYSQKNEDFVVRKGPIFANFVLADEINRSPAKVQSALLEAMQERQVTIGDNTYPLPQPFLVLATQNPLEQEGTYPPPEAPGAPVRYADVIGLSEPARGTVLAALVRMAERHPRLRFPEGAQGKTQQLRFELRVYYWMALLSGDPVWKERFETLLANGLRNYVTPAAIDGPLIQPSLNPDWTWNYVGGGGLTDQHSTNTHTPAYYCTEPNGFMFVYLHALRNNVFDRRPELDAFCRNFCENISV